MSKIHTEPIVAWRLWHVRRHEDELRLRFHAVTKHRALRGPDAQRVDARRKVAQREVARRAHGHECGIYAFRTRELAEDLLRRYTGIRQHYGRRYHELPPLRQGCPIALGRVSLWGRVIARQHGFRAQYAYPYELFLIGGEDGLARELRGLYAVDVWPS